MLICLIALTLVTNILCNESSQPEVTAPAGKFRGKVLTSQSGHDYASFRGIPYALPPIGDRRFGLPERFPVIQNVYDASEFGPVCLQKMEDASLGQEDCLYLNVYTPTPLCGKQEAAEGVELKKVLVFIHGGGFFMGASNPYLPGDLVTSDLVVVTLNYRLGLLGFLRGNSPSLPGNQGFWDQLLALKWVKDNIQAFGGDPNDVTISGESAGSMSASLLSISPLAKGLFGKAMLFSATIFTFDSVPRTSNDILHRAAVKLGCVRDSLDGNEETVVACLKRLPAETLEIVRSSDEIVSLISSEDDLLPKSIKELTNNPDYLSQVGFFQRDYLVSVTKQDGSVMINSRFHKIDTTSMESAARGIVNLFQIPLYVTKPLLIEYARLFDGLETSAIAVATDGFFIKQSLHFLNAYEKRPNHGKRSTENKSYLMSFDHSPKYIKNQYMLHALDLVYLFDLEPKFLNCFYYEDFEAGFTDEDFKLKSDYIDLVADFVKTSNPSETLTKKKSTVWPPYDSDTKSWLSLSLQPSIQQDILGDRRFIWDELVPRWRQKHMQQHNKQEL